MVCVYAKLYFATSAINDGVNNFSSSPFLKNGNNFFSENSFEFLISSS